MASEAYIDITVHPAAPHFYRQNLKEPIPGDSNSSVDVGHITNFSHVRLAQLLTAILKSTKAGGSIIVISHGTGQGLSIVVGRNASFQTSKLERDALALIRSNLAGQETDADTATRLFMSAAEYRDLKGLIGRVKQLKLARVDLRACNTGKDEDTMADLQEFFDCDVLCAPDILDSFGPINLGAPTKNPSAWEKWRKENPQANVEGTSLGRFAYQVVLDGPSAKITAMADSTERAVEWVKARIGSRSYTGGTAYYHALAQRAPRIFIFAAEAGFRDHLKQALRGQAPKRGPIIIDPNAPLPRP